MAKAASQTRSAGHLEPERGGIYFSDKNGNLVPAAIVKSYPVIFAVPKEIIDSESAAELLAGILDIKKDKLLSMLSQENSLYRLLVKKASNGQVSRVRELKLSGIYIDEENFRFYPFKTLASHVLGFVGPTAEDSDLRGRYGLESFYDDELGGKDGRFENGHVVAPVAGKDIYLSLDPNIETRAEEVLISLIQKYDAERGMVMVQEPKSGKILAMGAYPNFDPNDYSGNKVSDFLNPNMQSIFEPGSVMKIITMAGGLDSGKLAADTAFYDSGSLTLNGFTIKNWDKKAHGKITMTEVIEGSINTGAAYAEKLIGKDLFYNYLVKFGLGAKTGINFPGELNGSLDNLKKSSRDINFATASFGQGISLTPIQLINAISAIANGGVLMKPHLLKDEEPTVIRRVISEEAAREATKMMVSAVKKAAIAQIPKFDVAGKTGTAQIPDFKRGGYLTDDYIHTFVGFAPAYNPKFTILIRIDKPKGVSLAGLTVVPAFRELAEFILNYYNVPPDYID